MLGDGNQAVLTLRTSERISLPRSASSLLRSCWSYRFSQNSAEPPRYSARRVAVSGLMERASL